MEVVATILISGALSYLISEMKEARREISELREDLTSIQVRLPKRRTDRIPSEDDLI